jgi:Zn-dependent M16 (insulinase) family peptidase
MVLPRRSAPAKLWQKPPFILRPLTAALDVAELEELQEARRHLRSRQTEPISHRLLIKTAPGLPIQDIRQRDQNPKRRTRPKNPHRLANRIIKNDHKSPPITLLRSSSLLDKHPLAIRKNQLGNLNISCFVLHSHNLVDYTDKACSQSRDSCQLLVSPS